MSQVTSRGVVALRAKLDARPTLRRCYRIGVAVLGALVLTFGVVLIPYPGPGWLVVFAGLAILWLLDALALVTAWFGLPWPWLRSPLL